MNYASCILDHKAYDHKPSHIYHLNNRLNKSIFTYFSIPDLAKLQAKGYTCVPSKFVSNQDNSITRSNENWVSQEIFMLDMDSGVDFSESLDTARKNKLDFTYAYETFSSTDEVPKYRLCFKLTEPIVNGNLRDEKLRKLIEMFGADVKCSDRARLFFGGTKLIYKNYDYELNLDDI